MIILIIILSKLIQNVKLYYHFKPIYSIYTILFGSLIINFAPLAVFSILKLP